MTSRSVKLERALETLNRAARALAAAPSRLLRSVRRRVPERARGSAGEAGFTLLELLIVLAILALLATLAGPQVLKYLGKARTETARAQIGSISTALELYSLDNGRFPSQQAGLLALVNRPPEARGWNGPYLKRADGLLDPWGRPYVYRHPGRTTSVEVFTLGRDGAPGGTGEDQDLTSW